MVKLRSSKPLLRVRIPLSLMTNPSNFNKTKKTETPDIKKEFTWSHFFVNSSAYFIVKYIYLTFTHIFFLMSMRVSFKYKRGKKQESFKDEFSKIFLKESYALLLVEKNLFNIYVLQLLKSQYTFSNFENFRINYRLNFFKNGFYMLYNQLGSPKNVFLKNLNIFLSGWNYFLSFFSKWVVPFGFMIIFVYFSLIVKSLPFNKVLFVWVALFMVFYWLVSGFVFFFKKYQYAKFTSVIQRFWKRSLILFWLIEGGLLFVFIFLTLNSNNYLYNVVDQTQIFKTHLFSWKIFLLKVFPVTFLLLLTYLFLLNSKWQPLNKNLIFVITITTLLLYITWIEFYQFFHVMSYYNNLNWGYEAGDKFWTIKIDLRKTSQTNHLVSLLLILKFWHVLFILAVWVFFVLRSEESGRSRYPLISANFLNFVMLYALTWVYMYPWFKWFFRRYSNYSYKWFYQNNRSLGLRLFFTDLRLVFLSLADIKFLFLHYNPMSSFAISLFFQLKTSTGAQGFVDFNKKFVSSQILNDIFFVNDSYIQNHGFSSRLWALVAELGDSVWSYVFYQWVLSLELYELFL